jgi:hypothetical protein
MSPGDFLSCLLLLGFTGMHTLMPLKSLYKISVLSATKAHWLLQPSVSLPEKHEPPGYYQIL